MGLIPTFKDQADTDGSFYANISMGDALSYKGQFMNMLNSAAHELGIQIGVNETPDGLELGFEDPAHYTATMDVVEPRFNKVLSAASRSINRVIENADGGNTPKPLDQCRGEDNELAR
ncbi:MAG: hypothetical protein JJ931_05355 [Henriciella sp.]|nr:hypothetical protein [Henriciella sp.]MBO6694827.1 hypothetical protein [Henriciella sp.]